MIGVERIRDFYFAISISIEIGYRAYQPSEFIFVSTFIEANVFVTHEDTQNTHTQACIVLYTQACNIQISQIWTSWKVLAIWMLLILQIEWNARE